MPSKQPNHNANPLKRSAPGPLRDASRSRKRVKIQDARVIATQTTGKAFGNGEIDVDKFVKAREFEIRAMEDSIKRARKTLSSRAFQNVPRDLRRRTASHDVKRVPKRLRARAAREMVEDNTPTVNSKTRKPSSKARLRMETVKRLKNLTKKSDSVKDVSFRLEQGLPKDSVDNKLSTNVKLQPETGGQTKHRSPRIKRNTLQKPSKPKALFRKRQIHKTWLPTHLFHAKRAHMTPPTEPLWRIAIPLSPTEKVYRPVHRATRERGAVAWDMSYMSTIGLEGNEKSIINLLSALGVGKEIGDKFWTVSQRWVQGTRSWSGWLFECNEWPAKCIAPATIVWCAGNIGCRIPANEKSQVSSKKEKLRRKVLVRVHPSAFLQLWNEILKTSKIPQPRVLVEDLRFELGSIEIIGPAATEALVGALRPSPRNEDMKENRIPGETWKSLNFLTNPSSLPPNVIIPLNISDPRLHHPPRREQGTYGQAQELQLLQILSVWPLDAMPQISGLFDRSTRLEACRRLPSQKSINRRKAAAPPGAYPDPRPTDPKIPVLVLVSPPSNGNMGGWTLILPWKCVKPVWYSIIYHPLSSGGAVRFGGMDQIRQIAFEAGQPWFPADYPGTAAGFAWEVKERDKRRKEWEKRPKGKRVEWDSISLGKDRKGEIGDGWACHWEQLSGVQQLERTAARTPIYHVPKYLAMDKMRQCRASKDVEDLNGVLVTVNLTMLRRGAPTVCARIYRIPRKNAELRKQWLDMTIQKKRKNHKSLRLIKPPSDAPAHVQRQYLAVSLLIQPSDDDIEVGNDRYPQIPEEDDLIGFVTTGNFNLGEGKGTALGCLLLQKVFSLPGDGEAETEEERPDIRRLCIIRDAGQAFGRLARWELR